MWILTESSGRPRKFEDDDTDSVIHCLVDGEYDFVSVQRIVPHEMKEASLFSCPKIKDLMAALKSTLLNAMVEVE